MTVDTIKYTNTDENKILVEGANATMLDISTLKPIPTSLPPNPLSDRYLTGLGVSVSR